jgi:hypothetical protein
MVLMKLRVMCAAGAASAATACAWQLPPAPMASRMAGRQVGTAAAAQQHNNNVAHIMHAHVCDSLLHKLDSLRAKSLHTSMRMTASQQGGYSYG